MASRGEYGSKGQRWHPDFVAYIEEMAEHESYRGMPDAFLDDGRVQWEAPSNRQSGRHKDTYHKRLEWWRNKAVEVGIDPDSSQWISRTAKLIHPTKVKPCRRCGTVMAIPYVYPSDRLLDRISALAYVDESFSLDPLESISELITRLVTLYGERVLDDLPSILKTSKLSLPPIGRDLEGWLRWIEEDYVPSEPRGFLSPGAMSNAPDRLDGFHHFNRCCRGKADTGRHRTNLSTYVTDRRVFEYWNEGDWIAANKLMGLVRTRFGGEPCANGHPGPCDADHIGPLSLGFTHRPEFRLLCSACNSAKNNRLTLWDVEHLRDVESSGEVVISWHSRALWDARKLDAVDQESALRLSKLLRDNRHNVMAILSQLAREGHLTFLATYLDLEWSDYNVEFEGLRVEQHVTRFDRVVHTPRTTQYAAEQKARRCRIAFRSLYDYFAKPTRNSHLVVNKGVDQRVSAALTALRNSGEEVRLLDRQIQQLLLAENQDGAELGFRRIADEVPTADDLPPNFAAAKGEISAAMAAVAEELSGVWHDERYVRATLDLG